MRYLINFDKVINQLVPYYLRGRKLILYLQSCLKPLKTVNESFVQWAKETRIEASMTSQIYKFEWFLNRKFSKYFKNPEQRISIENQDDVGVPIFNEDASDIPDREQFVIYMSSEGESKGVKLYYTNELTDNSSHSFVVHCPELCKDSATGLLVDGVTEYEFVSMLTYYIEKYRLAGKTYIIKINK